MDGDSLFVWEGAILAVFFRGKAAVPDSNPMRAPVEAMADAFLADPSTPPRMQGFLHAVKAMILMDRQGHGGPSAQAAAERPVPSGPMPEMRFIEIARKGRSPDPERQAVLDHVARLLDLEFGNEKTKTAQLFDKLPDEMRAKIGGTEPKGNLSAMMHHSPLFVSHGRKGWTLANPPQPVFKHPPWMGPASTDNVTEDVQQQREAHTFTS